MFLVRCKGRAQGLRLRELGVSQHALADRCGKASVDCTHHQFGGLIGS